MIISVLGSGRMGKGLVKTLAGNVDKLLWGSRSTEKVSELIEQSKLSDVYAVNYDDALKADVIIHSMWYRDLIPWARENEEKLKGKILVDIVNPFTEDFSDFTTSWGTSAAEEIQKVLPDTKVVGAFKNTFFKIFDEPFHEGLVSDVYVTSNDETAKLTVIDVLSNIPFRVLDGGSLENNRTIERMTLFEREVALKYGNYPYVSFRMFGIPNK